MDVLFLLIVTFFLVESFISQFDPIYEIGDWSVFGLWLNLSLQQPSTDAAQANKIFTEAFGIQPLNNWREMHPRLVKYRTRYTRAIRKAINGFFDAFGYFPGEMQITIESWKKWKAELDANGDTLEGFVPNRESGIMGYFDGAIIYVVKPYESYIPQGMPSTRILQFKSPQS
jgi:hypothetical protein